jgi:hypothetical protein
VVRKPCERAIIFSAVLGGLSLDELNALLHSGFPDAAPVPPSSYEMLRRTYFGPMVAGIGAVASPTRNAFGDMIFSPPTMKDLSK